MWNTFPAYPLWFITQEHLLTVEMIQIYHTWHGCNDTLFSTYLICSYEFHHNWPHIKWTTNQRDHPSPCFSPEIWAFRDGKNDLQHFPQIKSIPLFTTVDNLWWYDSIDHNASSPKFSFYCVVRIKLNGSTHISPREAKHTYIYIT